jgi:hypothetical protein
MENLDDIFFLVEASGHAQWGMIDQITKKYPEAKDVDSSIIVIGHVMIGACEEGEQILLEKMPVSIQFRVILVEGLKVGFWEAPSQVVDHRMVSKWFTDNYHGRTENRRTKSERIDECLYAIEDWLADNTKAPE